MKILLWRGWSPTFDEGVTFSRVHEQALGGTETQMLWHAQHLGTLGYQVQVLGATVRDVSERCVDFVGCRDRGDQQAAIACGRITRPDVIFLEGSFDGAAFFRDVFPRAKIVHIGQNIDLHADKAAFACWRQIDVFAFVGVGHLADYCSRFPRLRHKFVLVRNALPWEEFHGRVGSVAQHNTVAWVGGWTKKGLRTWFEAMAQVLIQRCDLTWALFGPQYSSAGASAPTYLSAGLRLPLERMTFRSLPLMELLHEVASCRVVLVSLGNETGAISALDAHAMAKPVLSGNDMVYKFTNPEGTGLRVASTRQAKKALDFLLDNALVSQTLGEAGRRFVIEEYHERRQKEDLCQLLSYLQCGGPSLGFNQHGTTRWQERLQDQIDKVTRRWLSLRSR